MTANNQNPLGNVISQAMQKRTSRPSRLGLKQISLAVRGCFPDRYDYPSVPIPRFVSPVVTDRTTTIMHWLRLELEGIVANNVQYTQ